VPETQQARRFTIRSDVYFDVESKVLSAMLELPGMKKSDLSIKLNTCFYNRVRQVTVSGSSRSVFPDDGGFAVRERKHGDFSRTFPVPSDTKVRVLLFLTLS
jgi:HSP20 family molecular chaperone IbpA